MKQNSLRILIAGEGGQGVQVIALALVRAAHAVGKKVVQLPNFGVEQRGGVSLAFVQISETEISFPKFQECDVVVILAERAIKRVDEYLTKKTTILFDNSIVRQEKLADYRVEKIAIPATAMAKEKLIPRVFNMIILGALAEEVGIRASQVKKAVLELLSDKIKAKQELKHFNQAALDLGSKTIKKLKVGSK